MRQVQAAMSCARVVGGVMWLASAISAEGRCWCASAVHPGEVKKCADWIGLGIGYLFVAHSDCAGVIEGVREGVPSRVDQGCGFG